MQKAIITTASYWVNCPSCGEALTRGTLGFVHRPEEIRFDGDDPFTIGEQHICPECECKFIVDLPTE